LTNESYGRGEDGGLPFTSFNETDSTPGTSNGGSTSHTMQLVFSWNLISLPVTVA